jgi:hypothetical protein
VPEDGHGFQPEMAPHDVQVVHFGLHGDILRADALCRLPATTLIVIDDSGLFGQAIELGQQIVVVEVRTAAQHDNGRALADVSEMQSSGQRQSRIRYAHPRLKLSPDLSSG